MIIFQVYKLTFAFLYFLKLYLFVKRSLKSLQFEQLENKKMGQ